MPEERQDVVRSDRIVCLVFAALTTAGCGATPPSKVVDLDLPVARPEPAKPSAPDPLAATRERSTARAAQVAVEPSHGPKAGFRPIEGQGYRYEIPLEWEDLDPTVLGSPLISHAQRATAPVDGFTMNVNVASEPFVGDGPSYGAANLTELTKVSTTRDQRAAEVGPRAGWDIESFWANPGATPYVTMQRYTTNGSRGFVLTCSMAETAWARLRGSCSEILDSFRVE